MKKKIKKRTENDYLKSISNMVDLFYENRRLKRNINKAIEYIETLYIDEYDGNSYYIKDNTGKDDLGIEDITNNVKNILKVEE